MASKKSSTISKAVEPAKVSSPAVVKVEKHDHKDLELKIGSLEKEILALKEEVKSLKEKPEAGAKDERVDELHKLFVKFQDYNGLRQFFKRK